MRFIPGTVFFLRIRNSPRPADQADVLFIGPTVEQLDAVGDKLKARAHATAAGLHGVPGGEVRSLVEARAACRQDWLAHSD